VKTQYTHTGVIRGCDCRVRDTYRKTIQLRETKLYYISVAGTKYKKKDGTTIGEWPMYCLMLETVKPL